MNETKAIIIGFIFFVLVFVASFLFRIEKCRVESRLYNERYGTNYTTSDFYWASRTIRGRFHPQKEETYNLKISNT